MKLAAVGIRLDRQGCGYGVEAIEMALRAAESRAFGAGYSIVTVVGYVDANNEHSRKACTRAGLACIEAGEKYEEWAVSIELPPGV